MSLRLKWKRTATAQAGRHRQYTSLVGQSCEPRCLLASITLQASLDNTLIQDDRGALSNGSGEHLFVGATNQPSGNLRRAIIQFDLAGQLPEGAIVNGASLQLNMSKTRGPTTGVSLHRLTAQWGEGNSNAASEEGRGTAAA